MSRSYRIKVSQSLNRVLKAEDHVSSQLEILEILPAEQMAELLGRALQEQGFAVDGDIATREDDDVTITVELSTGTVSVRAESSQALRLSEERQALSYDDAPNRQQTQQRLRDELNARLEQTAKDQAEKLQQEVTDQLERALADVRAELDRAVNSATAQALKQKAAQIGQIKTMTEDPQTGSLTIVVEV